MTVPKQQDARQPIMRARQMRGWRDSLLSRSCAIRSRPHLQRTRPFLLPYRVVSKARLREFRQTPRPVATENQPTCSWPCAVRRQRQPEYAQGPSISIHRLLIFRMPALRAIPAESCRHYRELSPCARPPRSADPALDALSPVRGVSAPATGSARHRRSSCS